MVADTDEGKDIAAQIEALNKLPACYIRRLIR